MLRFTLAFVLVAGLNLARVAEVTQCTAQDDGFDFVYIIAAAMHDEQ